MQFSISCFFQCTEDDANYSKLTHMDVVILEQFEHKIINYVIGSYHVLGYFYPLNKLLVGEI